MKNIGITVYGCEQDEARAFDELAPRFGVAHAVTADAVSEGNAGLARGNRCISVGHKQKVSEPVIFSLRGAGVKYISTRSVGLDHIDMAAAGRAGIAVAGVGYSPDSVADHAVMLILMAVRDAKSIVRSVEQNDYRLGGERCGVLRDMTVGVVGTGRIGTAVIQRLRGFGCRVLAHGRGGGAAACGVPNASLDRLLRESDVVTLHLPLAADTWHIIDGERIRQMKRDAFIVNTGRGALVDTAALADALGSGKLRGAALDVIEGEEGVFYFDYRGKTVDNRLLRTLQAMPNVIITPHTAYYTARALREAVENTIRSCVGFERGAVSCVN